MATAVCLLRETPPEWTVVPVPLHTAKQRERGFNQTALLATAMYRALRGRLKGTSLKLALKALGRKRNTGTQSGLTPRQRRLNLRGAFFVVQPEAIQSRAVLLVDDIYTTGATARECTKTLLAAGAASVSVVTLARSQREGVAAWNMTAQAGSAATRVTGPAGMVNVSGFC